MSVKITEECINCGACLPECPNEAIFEVRSDAEAKGYKVSEGDGEGDTIYVITHDRCTECVGHFDDIQCQAVCPVDDCCIPDPQFPEAKEVLLQKARDLNPDKEIDEKYRTYAFELESGKVVTGMILEETPKTVKVIVDPLASAEAIGAKLLSLNATLKNWKLKTHSLAMRPHERSKKMRH